MLPGSEIIIEKDATCTLGQDKNVYVFDADDCKCDRVSVTKSDTPRVHQTSNKSDLVCYTKSELQRKIAESLAITRDADELREKYKALVKICAQE